MKRALFLFILTISHVRGNEYEEIRTKRQMLYPPPIVYPFGGTFKLILGFAVPVQLSGRILVYGQNFQFQYSLPPNATLFTNFFEEAATSRRRRKSIASDERMTVYKLLEEDLERRNIDGRNCLKKDICEAAASLLKDEGLIGELLHLLLTPDHGNSSSMDAEYLEAAEAGRRHENCSTIYSKCLAGHGILDRISTIV